MKPYQIRIEAVKLLHKINTPMQVVVQVAVLENRDGQPAYAQTTAVILSKNQANIGQSLEVVFNSERAPINNQLRFRVLTTDNSGAKQILGIASSFFTLAGARRELTLFDRNSKPNGSLEIGYPSTETHGSDRERQSKKSRKNSIDYLENKLSVLELETYEKDALIKNLTLQLNVKIEEAKYLFTSEKVKQMTAQLQQTNTKLRQRIAMLQKELSVRQTNLILSSNKIVAPPQQNFGVEMKLLSLVNLMSNLLGVGQTQNRSSDLESSNFEGVHRLLIRTQKMVKMVHKAYLDLKTENTQHLDRILQLKTEISKYEQQNLDKKHQIDIIKEQTVQLIHQLKKYTHIVNQKDEQAQKTKSRLEQALSECSKLTQNIQDTKLQCQRLHLQLEDANRIISNLRRDNCSLAKLTANHGESSLQHQSQVEQLTYQLNKSEEQLVKLKEDNLKLAKERDDCRNDLTELEFEVQQLKIMIGESEVESYNKVPKLDNHQKNNPATIKYQEKIDKLIKRVQQLEELETYAVEISNSLGYSPGKKHGPSK